jgi:hypothetical protein
LPSGRRLVRCITSGKPVVTSGSLLEFRSMMDAGKR